MRDEIEPMRGEIEHQYKYWNEHPRQGEHGLDGGGLGSGGPDWGGGSGVEGRGRAAGQQGPEWGLGCGVGARGQGKRRPEWVGGARGAAGRVGDREQGARVVVGLGDEEQGVRVGVGHAGARVEGQRAHGGQSRGRGACWNQSGGGGCTRQDGGWLGVWGACIWYDISPLWSPISPIWYAIPYLVSHPTIWYHIPLFGIPSPLSGIPSHYLVSHPTIWYLIPLTSHQSGILHSLIFYLFKRFWFLAIYFGVTSMFTGKIWSQVRSLITIDKSKKMRPNKL